MSQQTYPANMDSILAAFDRGDEKKIDEELVSFIAKVSSSDGNGPSRRKWTKIEESFL